MAIRYNHGGMRFKAQQPPTRKVPPYAGAKGYWKWPGKEAAESALKIGPGARRPESSGQRGNATPVSGPQAEATALEQLKRIATAIATAEHVSPERAMWEACKRNPELYARQVRTERAASCRRSSEQ